MCFSYAYNGWIDHSENNRNDFSSQRTQEFRRFGLIDSGQIAPYPRVLRATNISEPNRLVVFADTSRYKDSNMFAHYLDYRHGNRGTPRANMSFADGSARSFERDEVFVDRSEENYKVLNRGGIIWCPGGIED